MKLFAKKTSGQPLNSAQSEDNNPEGEKSGKERTRYYVDRNSDVTKSVFVCMGLAMLFRLIGSVGECSDSFYLYTQLILPLISALLFSLLLFFFGKRAIWTSIIGVIPGIAFFICRIIYMSPQLPLYQVILCIVLYIAVLLLWSFTVTGRIKTRIPLILIFALPFVYHVAVEDRIMIVAGEMSFAYGMQEMSVLCIMLALLFASIAMKKKNPENPVVYPVIKDPKITSCAGGEQEKEPEQDENLASENESEQISADEVKESINE